MSYSLRRGEKAIDIHDPQWYGEHMERFHDPSQALGAERRPYVEDVTVYQIPEMRHTAEAAETSKPEPDTIDDLTRVALLAASVTVEQDPKHNDKMEAKGMPQADATTETEPQTLTTETAEDRAVRAEMSTPEATKAHAEELLRKREVDRLAREAFDLAA